MFEQLTHGFTTAKNHFKGRTVLTQETLDPALHIIKTSLLDADVDYDVCESFLAGVTKRCLGKTIQSRHKSHGRAKKITTMDFFVTMCFEELKEIFGSDPYDFTFKSKLGVVMLVGLQGVGKTTTAGKLAQRLLKHKPLLVACDIYRPAAVEQLNVVAETVGVHCFFKADASPVEICRAAESYAYEHDHKMLIIDTAGRLSIDETLMTEIAELKGELAPEHTFLVLDAMMGQDAVVAATNFQQSVDYDAVIMTKLDGDARGGAALSMRHRTGKPIAFVGTGEAHQNLETFHPEGFSTRVLGMGDTISLMEDLEQLEGDLDPTSIHSLESLNFAKIAKVLTATRRLGPLSYLIKKLPFGISQLAQASQGSEQFVSRFIHLVDSMTPDERSLRATISPSRLERISSGAGVPLGLAKTIIYQVGATLQSLRNNKLNQLLQSMNLPGNAQQAMASALATTADDAAEDPEAGSRILHSPASSGRRTKEHLRKVNKQKRKSARKNRRRK